MKHQVALYYSLNTRPRFTFVKSATLVILLVTLVMFFPTQSTAQVNCCEGLRGNADCDQSGLVDLADLTTLIDYLFISFASLCCVDEANVDGSGGVDLGDLTALIDYLFISNAPLKLCDLSGGNPTGTLISSSSCKSFMTSMSAPDTPEDMDCVFYEYTADYTLSITHVNAGFNCCPVILAEIDITDNLITIMEIDSLDQGGCACLCLFDVEYRIVDLPPGQYRMHIVEPYMPMSDEPLDFMIDLGAPVSDSNCVARSNYPWGIW